MPNNKVRIRFAPSPTGSPHIGSVWQVLLEWLACRSQKGTFILRIEDTDRNRFIETAEQEIYDALAWLGLSVDEGPIQGGGYGPYRQSERLDIYRKHADILIQKGAAYFCFCTPDRLTKLREEQQANKQPVGYDRHCRKYDREDIEKRLYAGEPYVIRMKVPDGGETSFVDQIRGQVSFLNDLIDDQVLMKSDGWPTYHLANVVDDHLMEISDVIRGEEWLSSTPKHLLLYQAFEWTPPTYAHLPLILGNDRSKLSKRHGSAHLAEFIAQGYLPEAMINFLALLGWNPKSDRELFTLAELIEAFKLSDVNKSGAIFNRDKLDWFNAHYIKSLSIDELSTRVAPLFTKPYAEDSFHKALIVAQERAVRLSNFPSLIDDIINVEDYEVESLIWKKSTKEDTHSILEKLVPFVLEMDLSAMDKIEAQLKQYIAEHKLDTGSVLWPLRVALSGKKQSPSPFQLLWVLSPAEISVRLTNALKKFN